MPTDNKSTNTQAACDAKSLFIEVTGITHDPSYNIQFFESVKNEEYVVREGDNLSTLAADKNLTKKELLVENPHIKAPEYMIYAGETLLIPTPHQKKDGLMLGEAVTNLNDQHISTQVEKNVAQVLGNTTIYNWPWFETSTTINAYLNIDTKDAPITLPLFNNIKSKLRVDGEQDYLMQSVLPLTLLPTFKENATDEKRIAPARNGYLYVFYNLKAWREIEIRTSKSGQVEFKDVNLSAYRTELSDTFEENDFFSSDKRVSTGNPLKEIWLPAKENLRSSFVFLAYSEVQWSGERLNYFEANTPELRKRAQSLHHLTGVDNPEKGRPSERNVLPASGLPEMRVRQAEIELTIAEPLKFNRDLSGAWLNTTYRAIKNKMEEANKEGGKPFEQFRPVSSYQYEYGMKQAAIQQRLAADTKAEKVWKALESIDYLEDAKVRHLRTITLKDPLFDLRHRSFVVLSGVAYMQKLYEDMGNQEYYQSAELSQKMIMTEKFGQQENPLYAYKSGMNTNLADGRLHRTLRTFERLITNRDIKELQYYVEEEVSRDDTAASLRDVSSLNGMNGAGAHVIAGHAISALSIEIDKIDKFSEYKYIHNYLPVDMPLSTQKTINQEERHARLLSVLSDKGNPLHKVLFVKKGTASLEEGEEFKPVVPTNDGSGFMSPELLAQWEKDDFILDDEQLEVFDLAFITKQNIAASTEDKVKDAFTQTRRIGAVLNHIYKSYFEALMSLHQLGEETKVVQFNKAYVQVLGLLKVTNPSNFEKLTFTTSSGKKTTDLILVGWEIPKERYGLDNDNEHIKNKKIKGLQGTIVDENGVLVVSSNKKNRNFSNPEKLRNRVPFRGVFLPAGSDFVNSYNHENIQRALKNQNNTDINSSNAYKKIGIPYFVSVIEMMNLVTNFDHFVNLSKREDLLYSGLQVGSILWDLSVAIAHVANLHSQHASALVRSSHLIKAPYIKLPAIRIGSSILTSMSKLGAAGFAGGIITAGLAGWDAYRLFQKGDTDAGIAMSMVSAGLGVTSIATGLFTTNSPILFGMGPVAWVGIALAVTGSALYMWFLDNPPIEVWLANGPFGEEPEEKYIHLQNDKVAFDRFLNILFSVDVKMYTVGSKTRFSDDMNTKMQKDGVTHLLTVNNNIAALLDQDKIKVQFYARSAIQTTVQVTHPQSSREYHTVEQTSKKLVPIIHTINDGLGKTIYFVKFEGNLPKVSIQPYIKHSFREAFIIRTRLVVGDMSFPTLALDEADTVCLSDSARPNFTEDEDYWVNQDVIS